ncbi:MULTISPECIES: sn-glycerol-3-phosphate import ATP-binding protein UgpC [unclassified Herbaspirillum]|uniref:sn-glycerol-3-phosphate import ATP-binding protein UgpC n=1 Tax=unclassified Herbaspirillum TaxID=2624150 RepID=UPI001153D9A6|nr:MULTISPECIES: sn-glycerol-3-phosphate import ATP-binding protein UgpC [unclassified Herbaspirillum]MBB5391574.1 sn-glycerol 3-phosphate transport system ATP-binding protein [Herbaspirillum sp. SJZ102]TQK12744.1 sn-glycerol 3-phosphate transport system ATP-binding protein [Herbaspirillum sp. SJZ130]TQK14748.1 sn-glycerol 3-phosphate transport system ATP-binding protein [Herbaspirillum sp. SJZ106]TWC62834.1 sn-glycerol 3-phosphate transport system ATP-binding protein [Herbaspirillum sp. SJZ099
MAAIHLKQVRKTYGRGAKAVDVIHGIDAEIADGEFIVMVGPSGCGKSTLLRMVAGLEEVSGGQIVIGDRVVNELEPKERDIAMVFQNYALYPHMSVYENMAYGLKIAGLPKAEIDDRVQRAAAILELGALLERTPRQLSGGQRQRVAMGRAIVRKPAVFLFDEPLSNLDAKLRVQMRLEIQKLHASLRTTSLYVTHDQVEAMTLGQRMIVMNKGRAEQIGTPAEVYARPATTFVAGFIGSPPMNLLRGKLAADGAAFEAEQGGERGTIRLPQPAAAAGHERIWGVRPEHLLPVFDGSPAQLALDVELVEALGAELLVHGRCGGQPLVLRCPAHLRVAAGQRIGAAFGPADVHWFDAQTTHRL